MHTNRRRSTFCSVAFAAAAFLAAVAGPSALAAPAHPARAIPGPCRATTTWITVTDDQGVTWLRPVGDASCTTALACAAAASSYPGWVSVTDDIGVPWLYPVAQYASIARLACATAPAASTTAAVQDVPAPVAPADPPVSPAPYPGWVTVVDDQGVPWLEPAAVAGTAGR